ncbi:hypothetical protein MKW98_006112 [Papaver atlanticum]|uniref:Protein kinase domain-containing protein n=1 Tax=Papaver atlanticum TaxID=357466 RepID=A0AAD4TGK6_9MAGN|nr:hypothetical protein MKW98_006112 [Papaver atlanticum]
MNRIAGFFGSKLQSNSQTANSNLHIFDFEEIKTATDNFSREMIISEDKSGKTYRGVIAGKQVPVMIKILNLDVIQGSEEEWLESLMSLAQNAQLKHPSLVKLEGYCCKDEHRVIVYEFLRRGSLGDNLFHVADSETLTWTQRLIVASETAECLAFLLRTDKSTIAKTIECINTSSIFVDNEYKPKLMHFKPLLDGHGLVGGEPRQLPTVDSLPLDSGAEVHSNVENDAIYRYGIVLLEILTGSPSTISRTKSNTGQNLIKWNGRELKYPRDIINAMDEKLEGQYSKSSARIAGTLAYYCLRQDLINKRHTIVSVLEVMKLLKESNAALAGENSTHNEHHGEQKSKKK